MSPLVRIAGKLAGLVVLGAAAAALGLGVLTYVQPTEAAADTTTLAHHGGFGGRGVCGQAGLEAAAEALDMTVDELQTQMWGGRTLADLAEEAGVALEDVQAAVNEACQAQTRTAIEEAVTAGTITREHADWLLEGLDKGFWGGHDAGFGIGRGFGPRGFGGGRGGRSFLNPDTAPTATPAPGSTN